MDRGFEGAINFGGEGREEAILRRRRFPPLFHRMHRHFPRRWRGNW